MARWLTSIRDSFWTAKRAKAERAARAAAETAEADEARDETAGGPSDGAVNRNEHPSDGNVDLISLHDNDSGDDFYNSFAHNHNSSDNDYNGFRHFRNAYVPPPARLPVCTSSIQASRVDRLASSLADAAGRNSRRPAPIVLAALKPPAVVLHQRQRLPRYPPR